MVEKKKGKKRRKEFDPQGNEVDKPSKDEYAVAKWMRYHVPVKRTKLLNHLVEYFTAAPALDALMGSKFAEGDNALFTTREAAVHYLQVMLEHKFFHRAMKIPVSEQELRGKKKDKKAGGDSADEKKEKEKEKVKEKDVDKEKEKEEKIEKIEKEKEKVTDAESSVVEGKSADKPVEKEKRKRKIRLNMHNEQWFIDGMDAYVWIYDPIPFHYWIFGALLVLGAIGVCLFPLWPPSVRLGVYYLSVAAAGFLVFIIFLVVLRLIIFCLVWIFTAGKHHIWILPNLTEDVGLLASFWPLYKYEYKGEVDSASAKKKKKKDKDSDAEDEKDDKQEEPVVTDTESITDGKKTNKSSLESKKEDDRHSDKDGTDTGSQVELLPASESESESSQRSSTGRDFEMVDKDDLES